MNLDRIAIKLRARNNWEALDLGVRMIQSWWRLVYLVWFLVTLPILLLLNLIFYQNPLIAAAFLWWLKPLFDRMVLFVLSHAVFSEHLTLKPILQAWPKLWFRSCFYPMTLARFSPFRSFYLPVWQLEGLTGHARSKRQQILHRNVTSAGWLTIICLHLEGIIYMSLFMLIDLFAPITLQGDIWEQLMFEQSNIELLSNIFAYLAMTVIEPFYVASGFALYLNRRTQLEGWDIELNFRQFQQQQQSKTNTSHSTAIHHKKPITHSLLFALGLGLSFITATSLPSPAQAEIVNNNIAKENIAGSCDNEQIKHLNENTAAGKAIKQILQQADFKHCTVENRWYYSAEEDKDEDKLDLSWLDWLEDWQGMVSVAQLLEGLLWGIVISLVIWVAFHFKRWQHLFPRLYQPKSKKIPPKVLFGMDISPESLPKNIAEQALALYQQQHYREALSLLYRGALVSLVNHYAIELKTSATEQDCLLAIQSLSTELQHYFADLSQSWQFVAYAHKIPEQQQIADLCQAWPQHFALPSTITS